MKKIIPSLFPILLFLLFVAFFVHQAFLPNTLHYGEEQGLINYNFANWRYAQIWIGSMNFGNVGPWIFVTFTVGKFWYIASLLELDLVVTQHLFYFIVIFFTAYFFYLLAKIHTKNVLISILLSFIYITTYNYYASLDTSGRILQYLILPAGLFCWTQYHITKKIRFLFLNIAVILSTLSIANNPPQMIGAYSFIFIYVILLYGKREYFKQIILFLTPYIGTIFLVLSIDLLAIINSSKLFNYDPFSIPWSAPTSPLHDILRFFGSWGDYAGAGLIEHYNHLFEYYHSNTGIFLTFIPLFILLCLLLNVSSKKKRVGALIMIVIVINIILTVGSASPFGKIYEYSQNFQLFKIFREPWSKFIINVIFSTYIGIALLFSGQKKFIQIIVVSFLILYFGFQVYPLIMSNALDHRYIDWKVSDVQIPPYWKNIQTFSEKYMKDARTLVLPASINRGEGLTHNWKPYVHRGFPEQFFIPGNIVTNTGNDAGEIDLINLYYKNLDPKLISQSSIDYVLVKNDVIADPNTTVGVESIIETIDIESKKTFGKIDLYTIKKEYNTKKIRPMNALSQQEDSCDFGFNENSDSNSQVYVDKKDLDTLPILHNFSFDVKKISDSSYELLLHNKLSEPVGLLFAETYNEGWKIYSSRNTFAKPLKNIKHFPVNCFMNAWIIPSSAKLTDQTIYLKYEPQIFFDFIFYGFTGLLIIYGILVSVSSKLSLASFLNYLKINTKKTRSHSLWTFCINIPHILMLQYEKHKRLLHSCLMQQNVFLPFWILILGTFSILILNHIFVESSLGGDTMFGYSIVLFISYISIRLQSKFFIIGAFIMLILCSIFRIANNIAVAESLAAWILMLLILFVMTTIVESLFPHYSKDSDKNKKYLRKNFISLIRSLKKFLIFLKKYMTLKLSSNINNVYIKHIYKYYIFLKLIKSSKKNSFSIANLRKIIKEADISIKKIILHFIYMVAIAVLIGVFSYIYYLKVQYGNRLSRNFHITSIQPANTTPGRTAKLIGYNFGFKTDEKYRVLTDEGIVLEIVSWDKDFIEFIIPLSLPVGSHRIWIVRPTDELHRNQGFRKSNKITLAVHSRFSLLPDIGDTKIDRGIKKFKKILLDNYPKLSSYIFSIYKNE